MLRLLSDRCAQGRHFIGHAFFFKLGGVGVGRMVEVGKGVVQRGDTVYVIVFLCIGGNMVWIAPTLT